jgi:hypothetical membrane protein
MTRASRVAWQCAVVGLVLWVVGCSLAINAFSHSNAVPYSLWNHTISELGFPHASSLTWIYNSTLVLLGLLLLPTYHALRINLASRAGNVAAGFGSATSLMMSLIGLMGLRLDLTQSPYRFLPYLAHHNDVAAIFFLGWLVTVILFTRIFIGLRQDPFCRLAVCAGTAGVLLYPVFLWVALKSNPMEAALHRDLGDPRIRGWLTSPTSAAVFSPWLDSHRPALWWPAVLEWCLAGFIVLWHGAALLFLWKRAHSATRTDGP